MSATARPTIEHVFVLMLENRSFDNLLAFSGIPGIRHASPGDANTYRGSTYAVGAPGAPVAMPTDPGHEVADVVQQLCGRRGALVPWRSYPTAIDNSGFVSNYATTRSEFTKDSHRLPEPGEYRDVMACFDTPNQLPVLHQLATEFAVCDQWFASVPGPTWPNRFFLHGASSGGWADSPSLDVIKGWITSATKFRYPSGVSIFDRLSAAGRSWRVYGDTDGPAMGGVPLVAAITGVNYPDDIHPFSDFEPDLAGYYPYSYTFIEPNYGDVVGGSYVGGSSQHPLDGVARGEALIKSTYELLRSSSLWERSLLVVAYDEHGGFYDSVAPGAAPPPADGSPEAPSMNRRGFLFDHYGPRVPAVVISPWVSRGVDHTRYDHSSVPATIERLFGLAPLTARDRAANDLRHLLAEAAPRTDCPTVLSDPVPDPPRPAVSIGAADDEPLPASGTVHGTLAVLAAADLECSSGAIERGVVRDRIASLRTRGDARTYAEDVMARINDRRPG